MRTRSARPLLRPGDGVGVVATGFAVWPDRLAAGLERLARMGFRVVRGKHLLATEGYLAGDDDARTADLARMVRDPRVRAIWFARGGYGTARLLDRVPWRALRESGKSLLGYSDLTALFAPAVSRADCRCLYGPVVTELAEPTAYHGPTLRALLAGRETTLRFRARQVLAPGRAVGPLVGGNLAVLTHLLGTRYAPRLRGAILALEEVGEEVYRVDRMLTQWRLSGALASVAGVVLGGFRTTPRERFPADRPLDDVLREMLVPLGVPVVRDLPFGHVARKRTLPLGGRAELDTRAGSLRCRP